ncbi:MAG: acyl-CoA dehydrogenase family protein [Candidatus Bathyarchaeota archaeon]|nr:MAG: acyl-CoA dehydrogenase family protein [Candidatus Bathyarchaeota archaeon]
MMIEKLPWLTEEQKELADQVKAFADANLAMGEQVIWTREFPSDLLAQVAEKGWFGAPIPKEYGGKNLGVTGCCIIAEELSRICAALTAAYSVTMFGGVEQLIKFGNAEQKQRWLPQIAKGKLGGICITEPGVGSDAASIETTARKDGDDYILNGKKRFITNAGLADIYCLYARTSDSPEDRRKYRHLSAFIVERDTPGFTLERINELGGWIGLPNGYLDFNDAKIPKISLLGEEGDGWKVLVDGLNFERNLFAAGMLGPMREGIRYAVGHSQRRIQFNQPTIDSEINQFKIADMFARLATARLLVYHAAHLMDMKADAVMAATNAKLYASEAYERQMIDAMQVMGGDGWTQFYPVEAFMRDAKVNQLGAGTSEVMRMVLFRQGLRVMSEDLTMPYRKIHETLNVPISSTTRSKIAEVTEKSVLQMMADDYIVNPGLHMTKGDMVGLLQTTAEEKLVSVLAVLETKGLVHLLRDRKGRITHGKASFKGLKKAKPSEAYRWYPEWAKKLLKL